MSIHTPRSPRVRRLLSATSAAVAGIGLAGCGGGDRAAAPSEPLSPTAAAVSPALATAAPTPTPAAAKAPSWSTARRGIQGVYWLALTDQFATDIIAKLKAAPSSKLVEIEFSAAHDNGRGWKNARAAADALRQRGLVLTVDFGHHTIAPDRSPAAWGRALFTELVKGYSNDVLIAVQVANEDQYTNDQWTKLMAEILGALRDAWTADPATRGLAFPYSSIRVRRTPNRGGTVPTTFKISAKDKTGFATETEYHLPANSSSSTIWSTPAKVVSNDGQVVYRPGVDPRPWAKRDGTALLDVSLDDFMARFRGKTSVLLWHPALHRWGYRGQVYEYELGRSDADETNRKAFLSLLAEFLKS